MEDMLDTFLERLSSKGKLIGIDKDEEALKYCKKILSHHKNIKLFHNSYKNIQDILSPSEIFKINGMLLDLGLSSPQMDSKVRGFSYKINSDLDMRYDLSQEFKAIDLLNFKSKKEIADIIYFMVKKNAREALQIEFLKCDRFKMYIN